MAEAAEPKTDGVMLFHKHCGRMVHLTPNRKTATKVLFFDDRRFRHGPVFSEDPMEMGRLYQVCLEEVCQDNSMTSFGVVTQHPETYPIVDFNSFHPSVVSITPDDVWCLGGYEEIRREYLRIIPQHSRVGLALDRERTLHIFLNGQNMGVIARKIPSPCYFMYDILQTAQKITALPITILDQLNQEPKGKTSLSENQPSH